MFRKILIANRGEIACRIMRTAKWMGIRSVAVFSEADRDALHVREADEAYAIGPAPAAQSYLKFETIVSVAKEAGAEAIHPGYGFLAENADFAEACAASGIVFIGPPPDAIRAMGDKAAAKAIMEKAGVPVVPGYHGKAQDKAALLKAAEGIGFPVLLKASVGGGGKGMRIVRGRKDFDDALAGAKREAKSAFGDDRMLVEKLIERPRHIEVQVFGDTQGNVVHLFERDCSVQRRHQKVIEEAPAPGVDEGWRERICEAAVAAARAVDYVGAGTVEFIVESGPKGRPGDFFFMEMNTRLQVEHPVTEMTTGTNLVEWQLRVASGEALPMAQHNIAIAGHAIEARLYAEDPASGFLPSPGVLRYLDMPSFVPNLRIDSAFDTGGGSVPPDYDPMVAKVICWGEAREEAIQGLRDGLAEVKAVGVATNGRFLADILDHREFRIGGVDTGFIEKNLDDLVPAREPAPPRALALACLGLLRGQRSAAAGRALKSGDPWSPWARSEGWRLNDTGHTVLRFTDDGREVDILCRFEAGGYRLELPDGVVTAAAAMQTDLPPPRWGRDGEGVRPPTQASPTRGEGSNGATNDTGVILGGDDRAIFDGVPVQAIVVRDGDMLHVFHGGGHWELGIYDPLAAAEAHEGASGGLTAPMPGKVAAVHVKAGQGVAAGQPLIVVEAMKMEHSIHAPAAGTVTEIRFKTGDQVQEGDVLVVVEEGTGADA
jgi:3-methylcrotonyl-CoA carboxylase alpha subunit